MSPLEHRRSHELLDLRNSKRHSHAKIETPVLDAYSHTNPGQTNQHHQNQHNTARFRQNLVQAISEGAPGSQNRPVLEPRAQDPYPQRYLANKNPGLQNSPNPPANALAPLIHTQGYYLAAFARPQSHQLPPQEYYPTPGYSRENNDKNMKPDPGAPRGPANHNIPISHAPGSHPGVYQNAAPLLLAIGGQIPVSGHISTQMPQMQPQMPLSGYYQPSAMLPSPTVPGIASSQAQTPQTLRGAGLPRKRSLTACDTCRQKKSKCDNVRPRCGACVRAGNMHCRYRADMPGSDYSQFDPASLTILSKLDTILRHVRTPGDPSAAKERPFFQHCLWDMSMMSMIRWSSVQKVLKLSDADHAAWTRRLLAKYEREAGWSLPTKFRERIETCGALESLLRNSISNFTNSFFLNAHTKVPCLDIITLLESIEIYTLMHKANPKTSFVSMLEDYFALPEGEAVPQSYKDALLTLNLEDNAVRRRAFQKCCESVPLILIVCAIGVIASPVKLDNHQQFVSSMEEGKSLESCSANLSNCSSLIARDRKRLARSLVDYSKIISSIFPLSLRRNTLASIEYHIMLNQYHLYNIDPLNAHAAIVTASSEMMYYLERENLRLSSNDQLNYPFAEKRSIIDRLFWTCLKLECELRVELSPYVPLSGITQMDPPSPFLKIPDPVLSDDHLPDSVNLTNKYDDKNSWYFFLTEVAVRKVDNRLYDEIYSTDGIRSGLWDLDEFVEKDIWKLQIKYLKQYDAIISSLSPRIREFVLLEVNVDEIHASMKKRASRKRNGQEAFELDLLDNLDEFFIDEDLLLKAQSESVMFIKTRFLTSKIQLFRPILYLILENRISLTEIFEAAAAVLVQLKTEQTEREMALNQGISPLHSTSTSSVSNDHLQLDSSNSSSRFANNFMDGEEAYIEAIKAPSKGQSENKEDTFNDLIEYDNLKDESDPDFIIVKDYIAARKRVLQAFVKSLITIPKSNIPKIGLHRHSGLWYYYRQLIVGNVSIFMLYKKVQLVLKTLVQNNAFSGSEEVMEGLNLVFNRELIKGLLEYTLLILNYWKEESPDCEIYIEQIQLCLDTL